MSILSHRGYSIPKSKYSTSEIAQHRRQNTIIPYVEREEYAAFVKPIKIYQETGKRLYLPRFYGTKHFGPPEKDKLSVQEVDQISCKAKSKIKLRDNQQFAHSCLKRIKEKGGGIISLACGGGKTIVALWTAMQLGVKTAIVCHTTDLMQQWGERISQFIPGARIGIVQQNKIEVENVDFSIFSLSSLAQKNYKKDQFRTFGLSIWDEIHLMTTELFSRGFPKLCSKYSLGLSATPFRKDKCEVIFQQFVGPIMYLKKRDPDSNITVDVLNYMNTVEVKYNKWQKPLYTSTIIEVTNDKKRCEMIVSQIVKQFLAGRTILVLSEYIKHLKMLHASLNERVKKLKEESGDKKVLEKLEGFSSGLYIGEMKNDQRKISQGCRVILGTYRIASVGMDIPSLNTLIMASPRKEIEQSVGRVMRKNTGIYPKIIDIVDDHGIFKNQGSARRRFYRKYDYQIKIFKIDIDGNILASRKAPKGRKRKAENSRGEIVDVIDPDQLDMSQFLIAKDNNDVKEDDGGKPKKSKAGKDSGFLIRSE
jgi:superfamily II DNA or RNA helicase